MADLSARFTVEIDGMTINIEVEGERHLANAPDVLTAAARATDRCARAMREALRRPVVIEVDRG